MTAALKENTLKALIGGTRLRALLVLSISLFFLFSLSFLSFAETDEDHEENVADIEETIEFSSPSDSHEIINFNIFEDIARARKMLEKRQCGFKVVSSKKVIKVKKGKKVIRVVKRGRNELGAFTILLAVENLKNRDIQIIRVHPKFGSRTKDAVVEPGRSNGVNTKFTILYPQRHIVLAIKRPVRHGTTFREVVYTPYSEGLDIPAVREAGLEYLQNITGRAKNDLVNRRVRPLSCGSFIENDISVVLAIIEHIDPLKFTSGKYTVEKLINETLVILGTNRDNAYRYCVSKAGARGLFQFIPGTYRRIQRLYPRAGLINDFVHGMEDHENAAKASFLLFDADMNVLSEARKEQLLGNPAALGRFLASAYNCGPYRTRNVMDRYGDGWPSAVPSETQTYLHKFDCVLKWYRSYRQASR